MTFDEYFTARTGKPAPVITNEVFNVMISYTETEVEDLREELIRGLLAVTSANSVSQCMITAMLHAFDASLPPEALEQLKRTMVSLETIVNTVNVSADDEYGLKDIINRLEKFKESL